MQDLTLLDTSFLLFCIKRCHNLCSNQVMCANSIINSSQPEATPKCCGNKGTIVYGVVSVSGYSISCSPSWLKVLITG